MVYGRAFSMVEGSPLISLVARLFELCYNEANPARTMNAAGLSRQPLLPGCGTVSLIMEERTQEKLRL